MKKIILIIIAAGVLIGISVGVYLFNKKAKDFAHATPNIKTTVEEIYSQFNNDEVAATTKFVASDKVIQVRGILKEIIIEPDSTTTLILSDLNNEDASVKITLEDKNVKLGDKIAVGLIITVNGQCTGMLDDFITKKVQMIRGGVIE